MVAGGGAGPQLGFLVGISNWIRDWFTGRRRDSASEVERVARQERIDEYHRRHPDAPGAKQPPTDGTDN